MQRTVMIGAAIALLTTSAAFAQTNPPAASGRIAVPPPALSAPAAGPVEAAPLPPPESRDRSPRRMASHDDGERGERWRDGDRQKERRGWRDRGGGHDGWRAHHGGRTMAHRGGSSGAAFRLSAGEGGPSVAIKCAARDSTDDCVEAVLPLIETFMATGAAPAETVE